MHQLINNKKLRFLLFFIILFFLSTFNNYKLNEIYEEFFRVKTINIYGLEKNQRLSIYKKLNYLSKNNIFSVDKKRIYQIINSHNFIEDYLVSKKYPSEINLYFKHTNFVATTIKDNKKYFIGSNGNLIISENYDDNFSLPNVFGSFKVKDFLNFINLLNLSKIDIRDITDFYYFASNRWDIKFKNNLLVKFPNNKVKEAINIVKKIIEKKDIKKIIDLRVSNQVIILNE